MATTTFSKTMTLGDGTEVITTTSFKLHGFAFSASSSDSSSDQSDSDVEQPVNTDFYKQLSSHLPQEMVE